MPIKPENKKLYSKDWKEIRAKILKRANHRCENCGVKNYAIGGRDRDGYWEDKKPNESNVDFIVGGFERVIKIILTIAHLDQDPTNNDFGNLKALCQRCHFRHDRAHNLKKSADTRAAKYDAERPILKGMRNAK